MERGIALFPYLVIEDRKRHLESTADYKFMGEQDRIFPSPSMGFGAASSLLARVSSVGVAQRELRIVA